MSNKFVSAMISENNWKLTENLADSLKSTTNSLLDLFATIGALRTRTNADIERLFSLAFSDSPLLATKMSFYARNVRGGLGERRTARIIWKWLAKVYPDIIRKNLEFIPLFGRFDDLYEFIGTPLEKDIWEYTSKQLKVDVKSMKEHKPVSLLAKWLKSCNTTSKESRKLGRITAKNLNLSERDYRKLLSELRGHIDVIERRMSSRNWSTIRYESVPSKAMTNYRKAFSKRDNERFSEYLEKVTKGEAKINSATLYPYDIVEKILYKNEYSKVIEEQWKSLPNYVEGEHNILVMADVSGSMMGRPMATSVGLATYFAERNKGAFHNLFMSFSESPELISLKGSTLYERIRNAISTKWGMNTDIEKAFRMILNVAVANKISKDEMPVSLIIISDMEFDRCTRGGRKTYYEHMKELYAENGYELPKVIFWNVNARQTTFHATPKDGVQFASGQSTSVFKSVLSNAELGPVEMMLATLNDPMYECITI